MVWDSYGSLFSYKAVAVATCLFPVEPVPIPIVVDPLSILSLTLLALLDVLATDTLNQTKTLLLDNEGVIVADNPASL